MPRHDWIETETLERAERALPALLQDTTSYDDCAYDWPEVRFERLCIPFEEYELLLTRYTRIGTEGRFGGARRGEVAFVERLLSGSHEIGIVNPQEKRRKYRHHLLATTLSSGSVHNVRRGTAVSFRLLTSDALSVALASRPPTFDFQHLDPLVHNELADLFRGFYPR